MPRSLGSKNKKIVVAKEMPDVPVTARMPQPPRGGGEMPTPNPLADANPVAVQPQKELVAKKIPPKEPATEARIRELELLVESYSAKLDAVKTGNIEDMMKDPLYGASTYITARLGLDDELIPKPKQQIVNGQVVPQKVRVASISVFPDLIDPHQIDAKTKKPKKIAEDKGISRKKADLIRLSDVAVEISLIIDHDTREEDIFEMPMKDAIIAKAKEYQQKRLKGDQEHLQQLLMPK
jgi:hypothetical protein